MWLLRHIDKPAGFQLGLLKQLGLLNQLGLLGLLGTLEVGNT